MPSMQFTSVRTFPNPQNIKKIIFSCRKKYVACSRFITEGQPSASDHDRVSKIDSVSPEKLKELRRIGQNQKDVIKLGRKGVCDSLTAHIRSRWKTSEVRYPSKRQTHVPPTKSY